MQDNSGRLGRLRCQTDAGGQRYIEYAGAGWRGKRCCLPLPSPMFRRRANEGAARGLADWECASEDAHF